MEHQQLQSQSISSQSNKSFLSSQLTLSAFDIFTVAALLHEKQTAQPCANVSLSIQKEGKVNILGVKVSGSLKASADTDGALNANLGVSIPVHGRWSIKGSANYDKKSKTINSNIGVKFQHKF